MPLNFGEHADVIFDAPPLATVLCQIRFSPILSLTTSAGVAGFQESVRKAYPTMLDPERVVNIQVSETQIGGQAAAPVWKFADADGVWRVGIAVDFFSIETTDYRGITDFLRRLDFVLEAIARTVRHSSTTRVGLRKVNIVPLTEPRSQSVANLVRLPLQGPLTADLPIEPVAAVNFVQFDEEDNHLAIRYGLGQSETTPSGFILDLDYFTERPFEIAAHGSLTHLLQHFSDGMTNFFHWAMSPEYLQTLGPRPRTAEAIT